MKPLEILSVGTKKPARGSAITFSAEDLGAIALAFNQSGRSAPFVPGHPQDDEPEMGKALKLSAQNGKLMVTEYGDVDPSFKAIVNSGELSGVSVKLRLPNHPENKTGTYELRHVGFLGKSPPADEGIADASFTASEGEVILMATKKEATPKTDLPDGSRDESTPSPTPSQGEAEFSTRLAALERREAIFSKAQDVNPFLEDLIAEGKIRPDQKAGFVALFSQLPDSLEIEFKSPADGSVVKSHPVDFLKRFLVGLEKQIEYAELSGGKLPQTPTTDPVALAEKIDAYRSAQAAKGNEVSFAAASSYIRQHPDWTAS